MSSVNNIKCQVLFSGGPERTTDWSLATATVLEAHMRMKNVSVFIFENERKYNYLSCTRCTDNINHQDQNLPCMRSVPPVSPVLMIVVLYVNVICFGIEQTTMITFYDIIVLLVEYYSTPI